MSSPSYEHAALPSPVAAEHSQVAALGDAQAAPEWDPSWNAVAVSLIAAPPVGLVLLWLSKESSMQEKVTLTSLTAGLMGAYAIIAHAVVALR